MERNTVTDVDYPLTVTIQDESGKYGRWIGDIKVKGRDTSVVEELHATFPSVKKE
ncbi:MAG: hypothetical protein J07AB43_00960 [Candidatus Nanosalina sp. J07AB43]|nr:MAG: hypothetical protein J07AB43_00960 [Candidatus Nanosalina sp. J07AB43]